MDRKRLNYSAWLMRRLTEIVTRDRFNHGTHVDEIHGKIRLHGPHLLYNGTAEENTAVLSALDRNGIIIPKNCIHVIADQKIDNTFDQIMTFTMPESVGFSEGDSIGLVCHAPQMMRTLHMLAQQNNFPPNLERVYLFPLKSPPAGAIEYPILEASKMPFYIFEMKQASTSIFPNNLLSADVKK